ncbi:spore germination protein GerPC [Paenibacillus dakarensis]|uniref:spore germination protein GerPC n=1 Tax=Paenibacillus dakarensis TaxID=1527293 RepID=UPI0006D53E13|nr:spore germination protein GerPC [Paenibacillus dakarensis]
MHPFYIEQLVQEVKKQTEKLREMEQLLQYLRKDVDGLLNKSNTNIERIDYHFDLLKIEKLEGTLNIGMTQNAAKTLEDMMVNGQPLDKLQTDPERALRLVAIQESVNAYLNNEATSIIEKLALGQELKIDEKYITMIVQDIRGQVDARIVLYLDQMEANNSGTVNDFQVQNTIIQQVKRDIDTAIMKHFEQLSAGKQGLNETERIE